MMCCAEVRSYRRCQPPVLRPKSLGMYAETDDVRGGMGLEGVNEFQKFLDDGGLV